MVVAIAAWSLVVSPGKRVKHEVYRDFKITNAALGARLEDPKARSTLKVKYEPPPLSDLESDEEGDAPKSSPKKSGKRTEVALCSLTPGAIEQASLDITFLQDDILEFEIVGKNSIHLFGNYVDQSPLPTNLAPADYSDEESVDLRDVSSDVEINPDELDGLEDDDEDADRFEEIDEEGPSVGKKHRRDSDATDGDVSMNLSDSAKKANKKLKDQSGSAIPVGKPQENGESKKKEKKKKEKKEKGEGKGDTEGAANVGDKPKSGNLKDLGEGLKIKDVKVGNGKQAKSGNTVSMRYIGKLPDNSVFDSNTKGKPFTFKLGKGEVIKGWDRGVAGMAVGGERLIIVPPSLGYGNKAQSGIPAGSTLHFECKMVDIK